MNKLCCQVHSYLVCGSCSRIFCEVCWQADKTHIKKGAVFLEALYCPKAEVYVGTYNHRAVTKLRLKYRTPWALAPLAETQT